MEEIEEIEEIESFEDLLYTFVCGNFTSGVEIMRDNNIHPRDFVEKLENHVEMMGFQNLNDFQHGHFSPNFFVGLGVEYFCKNTL